MTYQGTGETKVVTRTYPKLFATLGEIGGAGEVVIILAALIYAYYNQRKLEESLRKDLLGGLSLKEVAGYFKNPMSQKEVQVRQRSDSRRPKSDLLNKEDYPVEDSQKVKFLTHKTTQLSKGLTQDEGFLPKQHCGAFEVNISEESNQDEKNHHSPQQSENKYKDEELDWGGGHKIDPESKFEPIKHPIMEKMEKKKLMKKPIIKKSVTSPNERGYLEKSTLKLRKLMDGWIRDHKNGVNLYKRMDMLDLMQALLFEEQDLALLPLVLLNLKRKKELQKIRQNVGRGTVVGRELKITPEQAITSLVKSTPRNSLKALVREFMLENLPPNCQKLVTQEKERFFEQNKQKREIIRFDLESQKSGPVSHQSKILQDLNIPLDVKGGVAGQNEPSSNRELLFKKRIQHPQAIQNQKYSRKRQKSKAPKPEIRANDGPPRLFVQPQIFSSKLKKTPNRKNQA